MKTMMMILTAASLTLTSFSSETVSEKESNKVVRQFTASIIDALKNESAESFATLFPTIAEFKKLMELNREVYGPYLKEAQNEFAIAYTQSLLPEVKESFAALVVEGKQRHIDWKNIENIRTEVGAESQEPSFSILFTSNSKTYKIVLEKVILVNGQLKVTQFVKLI